MVESKKHKDPQHRPSINEWSEDSRPRERLLSAGARSLSDAELLAILIHSGTPKQNAVELMQEVLHSCDESLDNLGSMSFEQLMKFNGIGPAKAVTILAACEFGRRRMKKDCVEKEVLDSSKKIYEDLLKGRFWDLTDEECWILLLNQSLHFISMEMVGKGGLTSVSADIRKIMRIAIEKNATAVVLAHNHPSGNLNPSREDDCTTHNLVEACKVMNIRMLDHLIVAGNRYYSYAEDGRL
ncbi:MAG: DNA repair protein RadC [Bacteroidaceae bacterium]|jgi:DNA repair protein RadC|nr:DNA repair protein RadC [Bacteroidaceae bacterium]